MAWTLSDRCGRAVWLSLALAVAVVGLVIGLRPKNSRAQDARAAAGRPGATRPGTTRPGATQPAPRPPARTSDGAVSVTIRPGEPGAVGETITATRRRGRCTLRIARVGRDERGAEEETVPLTAEEFAAVWDLVLAKQLYAFRPEKREGKVFDYGTRHLKIDWAGDAGAAAQTYEVSWDKPLQNRGTVDPVFSRLSRLAKDHGKKVRLESLVPL